MDACQRFLPAWIAHYRRERLATDLVAGLVVGILVIPQSLAYALLAGLPPQAGLYAGIFPVIVYAWIGSSMTQAVGPVAITAIMTFSLLSPLAAPASPHYLQLAAWLALISGLMVLAFGLLRLGFLAQLLSRPVVSGFISGSAVLIALSQLNRASTMTASKVPSMAELRESGDIEQDADLIVLMYTPPDEPELSDSFEATGLKLVRFLIEKNRNGRAGAAVDTAFDGSKMRFMRVSEALT